MNNIMNTLKLYYLNTNGNNNYFLKDRINKDALNKVIKTFYNDFLNHKNNFNNVIFNKYNKVLFLLKYTFIDIIKDLKTNNDIIKLFNFSKNKKVKDAIISYNYMPYILCINALNNRCNLNKKCYSNKQELAYKIKDNKLYCYSLINTLKNYVFVYYSIYTNNSKCFLYHALKNNTSALKNKTIIRFNNKADIKDNTILKYFNTMFLLLKRSSNIKYAYTYTKTLNLNYDLIDKNFIVNKSRGIKDIDALKQIIKYDNKFNSYITITKKDFKQYKKQLIKLYKKGIINICNASLNNNLNNSCSNCLNSCYQYNNKITVNILH